jgi:hypothetical protein
MTETQSSFAKKRLAMILAGGIAGVVVGLAGVYGVSTLTRNAGAFFAPGCQLPENSAFCAGDWRR